LDNVSEDLKLEELARQSGVSARTVRYYVQRGLLPAPVFRGRDTSYSSEHLLRLLAIRRLQDRFLPLDAIQAELARLGPDELRKLAEGKPAAHPYREPAAVPHVEPPTEHWRRWELVPGLEIHLSDRADAMTRALADELRALAERRAKGGTR
jgi:DNA-binding transcriptional MerR regulator